MSEPNIPIENSLTRTSVRIEAGKHNQPPISVGTGFFYKVQYPETGVARVFILTNKHVIKEAEVVHFVLSYADSLENLDQYNQPIGRIDRSYKIPLENLVINHPTESVDLCAIEVTIPVGEILESGKKLRVLVLDSSWLPEHEDKKDLRDIEQVMVVGYPRGLWDKHNNMPINRVGTTATHPLAKYQGNPNFLIDVAAFQGSSGSPVFTYEAPMFRTSEGSYSPGTKVQFIGIIWGVIESTVEGKLKIAEIPSVLTQVPIINTSLNLAIALHAEAVLTIDEIVLSQV